MKCIVTQKLIPLIRKNNQISIELKMSLKRNTQLAFIGLTNNYIHISIFWRISNIQIQVFNEYFSFSWVLL